MAKPETPESEEKKSKIAVDTQQKLADDHAKEPGKADGNAVPESNIDIKEDLFADTTQATVTNKKPRFVFLKRLVRSKKFRIIAPIVTVVLIAVAILVEPVKFALLNLVTSGSAEFVVIDDTTLVPVEKAKITVNGQTGETNKEGKAVISDLKFGNTTYTIEKATYKTVTQDIKIQPGGNFVGPVEFHSEGTPLSVTVTNKLSKQHVSAFKVAIDGTDISVLSDDNGEAIIKVPSDRLGDVTLVVSADGFNNTKQQVTVAPTENAPVVVEITPSGKHYFLSNRNGKVGVYASNLDGSDQVEIVPGTVAEDNGAQLSVAPDGKHAALVSKRDDQKGPDGNILPALFIIDLEQKDARRVDQGAPSFIITGWANSGTVVYAVSYNDINRSDNTRLKRVDVTSGRIDTLYTSAGYSVFYHFDEDPGRVYFNNYDHIHARYGLFSVGVQDKNVRQLYQHSTHELRHTKPYLISFKHDTKWYEIDMRSQAVKESSQSGDNVMDLTFSPNRQRTAWLESRDGKGTIIVANADTSDPKQATTGINVSSIVRWVSEDYLIYYVNSGGESAHYILHIPSGTITKISDVYQSVINRYY